MLQDRMSKRFSIICSLFTCSMGLVAFGSTVPPPEDVHGARRREVSVNCTCFLTFLLLSECSALFSFHL